MFTRCTGWASFMTLAVLILCAGCGGNCREGEPPRAAVAAQGDPPRCSDLASRSVPDLAATCHRVAAIVAEEQTSYIETFAMHGLLPPKRVQWAVQTEHTCPRGLLFARRIRQALAEECSRSGVLIREPAPGKQAEGRLTLAVTTDFDTPFDLVACVFELTVGNRDRVYRTSFRPSNGLLYIRSDSPEGLLVNTSREGLPVEFQVQPEQWQLMPLGKYRSIEVETSNGIWIPPSLIIGNQNWWDVSSPSSAPPNSATTPNPTTTVCAKSPEQLPWSGSDRPQVLILTPQSHEMVPRSFKVSGLARHLNGSMLEVVVKATGGGTYQQRRSAPIASGRWEVQGLTAGRTGDNVGATFEIRATVRSAEGDSITSQTVIVVKG